MNFETERQRGGCSVMVVSVITARGGSKRIPKKNIRLFAGKPIIAYSIEASIQSGVFDRVIVSTDSEEIADVAREYGAEVPFMRPAHLADDFTHTAPVLKHAATWLIEHGENLKHMCCVYPTAPFVTSAVIKEGFDILTKNNVSSVFTVTTFSYPIFRSLKINNNGYLEMIWPEYSQSRSNDLPEAYHDAGQLYWLNVEQFLKTEELVATDAMPLVLPRYSVQDIDNEEDWATAEKMYLFLKSCDRT
jgi:pseudaminic acid cytidylyltransferase